MRSIILLLAMGMVCSLRVPVLAAPVREGPESLDAWLAGHADLKKHIVWITGDGKRELYDEWSPEMKARIEGFYRKFVAGDAHLDMRLPDPGKMVMKNGRAFYTADEAFDLYAAHAAHVIFVEAKHLVPWSIESRPAAELEELLASSGYVARIKPSANKDYPPGIQPNRDFAECAQNDALGELNADPRIGFDFLAGKTSALHQRLIGETELQTLVHLTAWLRDNVAHGPMDDKKQERASRQRWLEQRLRAPAGSHTAIAIEGCHSSAKLIADLARSVNIPLLHARALDATADGGHFFNRTHGGLIYGWGGREPRILWHADEINAMPGSTCFPLDPQTGGLATAAQADQQFFDELWATPQRLAKAGFVYHLERVLPGKGEGQPSSGEYEDRYDYGMMSGHWNKKGKSRLDEIYQLSHDYALCGQPLLEQVDQLILNTKSWKGEFADSEVPLLRPAKDYTERSDAGLKALGGADKFQKLCKAWDQARGKNLLTQAGPVVGPRPADPAPAAGPLELRIAVSKDDPSQIVCEARNTSRAAVAIKAFGGPENRVMVDLPDGKEISLGCPPDNVTEIAAGATAVWRVDLSRYRQLAAGGSYKLVWHLGAQRSNSLVVNR